ERLAEELGNAARYRPDQVWEELEAWLDQPVRPSPEFQAAWDAAGRQRAAIVPKIRDEIARIAGERRDDVGAWQAAFEAGEVPVGYRRRMLLGNQIVTALAAEPPRGQEAGAAELGLALALLAQAFLDRDDESALAAAPDEPARR